MAKTPELRLTPKPFLCLTFEVIEIRNTPDVRQQAERRSYAELSENRWTQSLADGCALMRVNDGIAIDVVGQEDGGGVSRRWRWMAVWVGRCGSGGRGGTVGAPPRPAAGRAARQDEPRRQQEQHPGMLPGKFPLRHNDQVRGFCPGEGLNHALGFVTVAKMPSFTYDAAAFDEWPAQSEPTRALLAERCVKTENTDAVSI